MPFDRVDKHGLGFRIKIMKTGQKKKKIIIIISWHLHRLGVVLHGETNSFQNTFILTPVTLGKQRVSFPSGVKRTQFENLIEMRMGGCALNLN